MSDKPELKTKPVKRIDKPRVLIVEGEDDKLLVEAVLADLGCDLNAVETRPIGGSNIKNSLPVLLGEPEFGIVRRFGVIVDADSEPQMAFQRIAALLGTRPGLPIPERPGEFKHDGDMAVGIFLVPGDGPGNLEDLFLRSNAGHAAMGCVDGYFKCLRGVLTQKSKEAIQDASSAFFPKNEAKARSQALLAAMYETYPKIGVAAQKRYWNFKHPSLEPLRVFLREWMDLPAEDRR